MNSASFSHTFSALLAGLFLLSMTNAQPKQPAEGYGISSVKSSEARVLLAKTPYAVVLRDLGTNTSRADLFYGFLNDKHGVDHVYQFNSQQALASGRADAVWLFSETKRCVPNSAVVYNGFLYCRLWTTKYDEYTNPSLSRRVIQPVTLARFNLISAAVPTKAACDPKAAAPAVTAAQLVNSVDLFDRLPPSATNTINFLDKYDVKIDGPLNIQLDRPNMNVRFHVDESGMWVLAPYQQTETRNPYLRRLRIDPITLATSQVSYPSAGVQDTSPMIMMNYGIGVVVNGLYYGLGRTGEGTTWFRQRPSKDCFSSDMGPYVSSKDGAYLILENPPSSEYVSNIQFNPLFNEISYTVRDLQKPLGEQYRHVIMPVTRK